MTLAGYMKAALRVFESVSGIFSDECSFELRDRHIAFCHGRGRA